MGRDNEPDYMILFAVLALLGIGIVMVYSSSSVKSAVQLGDSFFYLKRQTAWAAIGIVLMLVASRFDYWHLENWARTIFIITFILIIVVLVPGLGRAAGGARRWLGVGALSFNPSEVMKLSFVIFMAWYLNRLKGDVRFFFRGLLPPVAILGVTFGLIMLQPDLGTAVALAGTVVIMLFVAGARLGHLFLIGLASLPALVWLVVGEEYRLRRILSFLNPQADPLGSGYHIIQSLYALGSGGIFGLGLGRSRQKLFYLPEQHTDFIYAILGEEMGLIGALAVLALFFLFGWRGYRVAIKAPDLLGAFLACGVTTMVVLQALINIGVVTSVLPITGIPLPFISFGGSSLVFTLVGVGILLNVSRYAER